MMGSTNTEEEAFAQLDYFRGAFWLPMTSRVPFSLCHPPIYYRTTCNESDVFCRPRATYSPVKITAVQIALLICSGTAKRRANAESGKHVQHLPLGSCVVTCSFHSTGIRIKLTAKHLLWHSTVALVAPLPSTNGVSA